MKLSPLLVYLLPMMTKHPKTLWQTCFDAAIMKVQREENFISYLSSGMSLQVIEIDVFCFSRSVLHTGTAYDSLHALWENKDRLDIVITNAQKLKSEGLAIIQHIEQKLKLKILCK